MAVSPLIGVTDSSGFTQPVGNGLTVTVATGGTMQVFLENTANVERWEFTLSSTPGFTYQGQKFVWTQGMQNVLYIPAPLVGGLTWTFTSVVTDGYSQVQTCAGGFQTSAGGSGGGGAYSSIGPTTAYSLGNSGGPSGLGFTAQYLVAKQALDPRDFGAIGDGTSHPLSTVYSTLAQAQAVYPFANSLTNELDWCGIQAAINATQSAIPSSGIPNAVGHEISIGKGTFLYNQPIYCSQTVGLKITGRGGVSAGTPNGEGGGTSLVYTGGASPTWSATTQFYVGQFVTVNLGNGLIFTYRCITAGISGSSTPAWVTNIGSVSDGTVTWEYWDFGQMAAFMATSVSGFTIQDLSLLYTSLSFSGSLLSFRHSGGTIVSGGDATKWTVRNVSFSGYNAGLLQPPTVPRGCKKLLDIGAAIIGLVDNCFFGVAQYGIYGQFDIQGNVGYSNAITISNCCFVYCQYAIANPGQNWLISGCAFEGSGGVMWHVLSDDFPYSTSNQIQFYAVSAPGSPSPSNNCIGRTTGSFLDDGVQNGSLTVTNTTSNNGTLTITSVFDAYIIVSNTVTNETSQTATLVTAPEFPTIQANQLQFHSGSNTITRTDGGSFLAEEWMLGDVVTIFDVGGANGGGTTVTAVTASTMTVAKSLTTENSETAYLLFSNGGGGSTTFVSNWQGDQFVSTPLIYFRGNVDQIAFIGGSWQGPSSTRVATFNNGGGALYCSNVQIGVSRPPFCFNQNGWQGVVILGNETGTVPFLDGNQASTPGAISHKLIMGNLYAGSNTSDDVQFYGGAQPFSIASGKLLVGATSSAEASLVQVSGNVEAIGNPNGFVLASPNGTRYLIQVSNAGVLSTTSAP